MTIAMQHLQFSDPISSPVYCAILASNDPRDDRLDQQSSEIMRRFRAQNLGGFPSLKTFHQESDPQDSRPPGSMVCCTEEIGTGRFLQLQSNCHFAFMDDEFTLIPLSSLDRIQKQNFEIIRKTVVTRVCTTATVCSKKKHLIHQCFSIFTPLAIFLTDHRQPQAEDHGHAVCSHPARHSPTNPGSERRISIDILQLRMKLGITLAIPNLLISSPKKEKNLLKTLALSHKSKKFTLGSCRIRHF